MRYLISTIFIALLLWSCDNTPAVSAKPQMVRKKIVAAKDNTAQASPKKTVQTAKTKPDAKPRTKTIVAKVDQTQAKAKNEPAAANDPASKPLIAKTEETGPVQNNQPDPAKQKKPAISPKSEITDVKPAVKNDEQADDGKAVAEIKIKKSEPDTAPNSLPGGVPPMYNPSGKIDPFEPLFKEKPVLAKDSKKIKRTPRTPLERIDLSQLKLVGIILASSGNRALVQEASGKGYIIKEGTYIGVNSGKVTEIKNDRVIVEEEIEDVVGKPTIRNKELVLPKPPGE